MFRAAALRSLEEDCPWVREDFQSDLHCWQTRRPQRPASTPRTCASSPASRHRSRGARSTRPGRRRGRPFDVRSLSPAGSPIGLRLVSPLRASTDDGPAPRAGAARGGDDDRSAGHRLRHRAEGRRRRTGRAGRPPPGTSPPAGNAPTTSSTTAGPRCAPLPAPPGSAPPGSSPRRPDTPTLPRASTPIPTGCPSTWPTPTTCTTWTASSSPRPPMTPHPGSPPSTPTAPTGPGSQPRNPHRSEQMNNRQRAD